MSVNVLYLMEFPLDLPGGAQMSTQTLCEGLVGTKYVPIVACPRLLSTKANDYQYRIEEYSTHENREDNSIYRVVNLFRRIGAFYRIVKKVRPDIVHIMLSESLITYGFLRCLGIFRNIPFTYTDRGLYYGYRAHSAFCMKKALKYADRMVCTTQFNKNLWANNTKKIKIDVISNTVSYAFETYDEDKRRKLRMEAGLKESDFVIGFAGRISEEKDWPFVKELVSAYVQKGIKFKVAIVISIYEEQDIAIVEELKKSIVAVVGEDHLIYRQDLSQKEISDFYYLVDVFVMSSMFESFGKTAVEAMSRKCSVVSTSVGGLTEVVAKEENLYTKEDYWKSVNRIYRLYAEQEELSRDKEYFYNRYTRQYRRDIYLDQHQKLYEDILARNL